MQVVDATTAEDRTAEELAGLDELEQVGSQRPPLARRIFTVTWPKVAGAAPFIFLWQVVVWSGWKPEFLLPPPGEVFGELWEMLKDGTLVEATKLTMWRAVSGYAVAVVIGVIVGSLVARVRFLRLAFGSMITGLQTMPSIAWFPWRSCSSG